jgi:Domain of unknown function (DUF4340)
MLWKRTVRMLIGFAALTFLAAAAAAWPTSGKIDRLTVVPTAKDVIARIEVTRSDGSYSLEKAGDAWTIEPGGYPVESTLVDRALATAAEFGGGIAVSNSAASHAKFEVADNAMSLAVYTNDGLAWSLLVGKTSADNRGNYVRQPGKDKVYAAPVRFKGIFDQEADRWRQRSIGALDNDSIVTLTLGGADLPQPVTLTKSEDVWTFAAPAPELPANYRLDSKKVARIIRSIATLRAADFADEIDPVEAGLMPPQRTATVATAAGESVTIELGKQNEKQFYIKRGADPQIYFIAEQAAKNLRSDLASLRDLHVIRFDAKTAERLSIETADGKLVLAKTGEDMWTVAESTEPPPEGFVLDPGKVKSLARSLSTLQGKELIGTNAPDAGVNKPVGSITVTLAGGETKKLTVGAETENGNIHLQGEGLVYLADKSAAGRVLKKLTDLKVSAKRPQQPQFDPAMLDRLPPEMRDKFLQEQRQKIYQNQVMQQMIKQAEKQKKGQ